MGSESVWREPDWLAGAQAWIDEQLQRAGSMRIGSIQQPHMTAWATVLRAPTRQGDVYFKAVSPAFRFEVELTDYLARVWPGTSPRLLATDPDRGWLLMVDGGLRLREMLKQKPDLSHWESTLLSYARFQQETIDHASQFLEFGVPDRRLPVLMERFDHFLESPGELVGAELTQPDVERLLTARPALERCCHELAASGIEAGLDHGDFHDGNVFFDQGTYIFFDWGDAGLTHPFFSLRTAFVSLELSLGYNEDDPIIDRLSEHYLRQWVDWGPISALRKAYRWSKPLASINAAVRWQRAIDDLGSDDRREYKDYVPSLLGEVLMGLDQLPF